MTTRPITRPITSPIARAVTANFGNVWNPRALFALGEQGVIYDPNDLTYDKIAWRRNLLTYSEQLDNASWSKVGANITANATAAPDGTMSADKLVEGTANLQHRLERPSLVVGVENTVSVFAKAAERSQISLNEAGVSIAVFDLLLGEVVLTQSGVTASIASVGDGWFRCTWTKVAEFSALRVGSAVGGSSAYIGDGVSGVYLWGVQLDVGSSATAYQKITDFNTEFMAAFPNHALFQDSASTTPVTAAGQPVGLMLDKRLGLVRGAELSNKAVVYGLPFDGSTFTPYLLGGQLVAGKTYVLEITVNNYSGSGNIGYSTSDFSTPLIIGNGSFRFIATAKLSRELLITTGPTATANFSGISVRELPGNHAFQPTAASRPMLRDTPRRVDYDAVDDVLNVTFPSALGSACTVARSIPGVGAQILTAQTIATSFTDNVDNCGLIIINRALNPTETANLTRYLNQRAGV